MYRFAIPSRRNQGPASGETKAELLDALSEEASHLKDEARVLLKRRRELLSWRKNLLRSRTADCSRMASPGVHLS